MIATDCKKKKKKKKKGFSEPQGPKFCANLQCIVLRLKLLSILPIGSIHTWLQGIII